ncbi:hypothetical protein [Roseibacillus persicicus]|uniref:hypothetical protein n=1 Tax=Roseibacillus persicicus TaxID=454148 RepID=UPI00280C4CD6|nr:hypothetical protein [Roseibacillus persicicus]MDQ8188806.1 hypothetical protein [Roseibacillus persicicus]
MKRALLALGWVASLVPAVADPLHGPNVNPSNFAVLVEWEKFTDQQAGVIGDNLSAETWSVYREALSWKDEEPKGAIAQQLKRWGNAFDGNGVLESSEGEEEYVGVPRGALSDYVVEMAIPLFPNRMEGPEGDLRGASLVEDRWQMGEEANRHHTEAKQAFRALAKALVEAGLADARLRLGWELTGDWFPWGIDPKGSNAGTAEEFKDCWKFVYLTMEEVNPRFTWVWNCTLGFDHFDPSKAFPEYPDLNFADPADQKDKILAEFMSVDLYDADGECYYRSDEDIEIERESMVSYWNLHPEKQKRAFLALQKKVFEGRGHLAKEGESRTYGLRFFKEFADSKRLPLAVSEWGPWANFVLQRNSEDGTKLNSIGYGGDDNPYFIAGAIDWFRENEVAYACLFEFYNGGEGDTVDHTILPHYWNSSREGRPLMSLYPSESPFYPIKDQIHPRAAKAYLESLSEAGGESD